MVGGFVAGSDYISVVRDLWDSEELKIESEYISSLKATVEKICSERSEIFEQCFEEVKEGIERVRAINSVESKEQPYFRGMYLYLAQELLGALEKLPKWYNDPIL